MPRLKGSADLLEDRRRRALALWDTGLSLNEVGRRIRAPRVPSCDGSAHGVEAAPTLCGCASRRDAR